MNYIAELNAFYDLKMGGARLSPSAMILWYCLMAICNRRRWENPFPVSRNQIIQLTELSDRTIRKARDELKSAGLIDYAPQGANRATLYTLKSIADQECCAKMHSTDQECCAKMHSTDTEVLCKNAHYIKHIENNNKNTILSKSNLDDSALEQSDESKKSASEPKKKKQQPEYTPAFLRFWEAYPRKVAKDEAFKVWKAKGIEKDPEQVETIISHVEKRKKAIGGDGRNGWAGVNMQFIPYPAKFLNVKRWTDDLSNQQESKRSAGGLLMSKTIEY